MRSARRDKRLRSTSPAHDVKIVIISPGQLGSNPRVVKEAATLAEVGHDVQVVATKVATLVESRDQAIMRDARFSIERVAFRDSLSWKLARVQQEIAKRLSGPILNNFISDLTVSAMTPALSNAAFKHRAQLYIAHYPAALPAAARAAAYHGGSFAFDAEDFHIGDLPEGPGSVKVRQHIRRLESRYLPSAAYVSAAAPLIAEAYAEEYRIRQPATILNLFTKKNAPIAPTNHGYANHSPSIYWFSQTIGPGRGLEAAIEAASIAKSRPHLFLRGTGTRGYLERLTGLAEQFGISDRLHYLPPCDPPDMERLGAIYDIGLVGELAQTLNRQIALTNKIFSYLTSGLAIVASDIRSHRHLQDAVRGAIALFEVGSARSLASSLDQILLDPSRLAAMRSAAWSLGQGTFSWEAHKHKLLDLVDNVSASIPRSSSRPS